MSVESARKEDVQVGDQMPDGTIYAGFSPDTHKPMYATPQDATQFFGLSHTFNFEGAQKYAKNLKAHGYHDFHAPSKGELNVLWENRNKGKLAGTFNETGSYWSCPLGIGLAWAQYFSDGIQIAPDRSLDLFLRCVR